MCQWTRLGVGVGGGVVRVGAATQEMLLAVFKVLLLYVSFGVCKEISDQ